MVRARPFAVVTTSALALLLAGCGDSTATSSSTTSTSEVAPGAGESSPAPATDPATATPNAAVPECKPAPAPKDPASIPSFQAAPDKATAAGKTFLATVTTSCGDIVMELDGAKAPQTVASFKQLAEKGYWESSPCHRLTTAGIFVLQCGDPTGTGSGNPGYGYGIENAPKDGSYPAGTLAMARTMDPNSNGGQFFIVYQDTMLPTEGGGYSIFGKVTKGMDLLKKIAAAGVEGGQQDGPPAQKISIMKVTVTEKKA